MNKELLLKKIFLYFVVLSVSFSTFAQTPYNIVMNLYGDTDTQMSFNWFCDPGVTNGKVEIIGVNPVTATCTQYSGFTRNEAVVTGLSPNTTYSFKVCNNNTCSTTGTFTTAKAKGNKDPFSFVYITDSQDGNLQNNVTLASQNCPNAKFWIHCGDLVWDDVNSQTELTSKWGVFFTVLQSIFMQKPFAPVLGNHDNRHNHFKHLFKLNSESFDSRGSTYTYIYGDAQFFAINGEQYGDSTYFTDMKTWMQNQINHPQNQNIKWRIVYFHKSTYTGAGDLQNTGYSEKQWRLNITPFLDELNIDLVLYGHDHVYQVIGPVYNKELVAGSVSNVQSAPYDPLKNVSAKKGGIFNVKEGTLYFCNGHIGWYLFYPLPFSSMPGSQSDDIPNYPSLFTGMFGQPGNSTYSNVSVSTENIVITTYEINNGNSQFLDEIKIVKYCEPYTQGKVEYTSNQTLTNTTLIIGEELCIKNNTTATFKNSSLRFHSSAKVVIEPGSKLVIDNTTMTNSCPNALWQGITVMGDLTKPVTTQYQGFVEVKNGGKIENARCGITVKGGASVETSEAHFMNNTVGVLFEPKAAGGTFKLTNFVLNNSYLGESGTSSWGDKRDFVAHLKMQNSGTVNVTGCNFSSTAPSYISLRNRGIDASNTHLIIKEYCPPNAPVLQPMKFCNESFSTKNIFSGFYYAIHFFDFGTLAKLKVRFSHFENNLHSSIYTGGSKYVELFKNKFNVNKPNTFGVYTRESWGFQIEENDFQDKQPSANKETVGIRVINSGSTENEIYRNQYNYLSIAQQFMGRNSSQTFNTGGGGNDEEEQEETDIRGIEPGTGVAQYKKVTGLQSLCNIFKNSEYADMLIGSWGYPADDKNSIRREQGSYANPAGNEFRSNPVLNIDNTLSQHALNYFYDMNDAYAFPNNVSSNVFRIPTPASNGCPAKFGTGGGSGGVTLALEQYITWNREYEFWLGQMLAFEGEVQEEYSTLLEKISYYSGLKDNLYTAIIADTFGDDDEPDVAAINEDLRTIFYYRGSFNDYLSIAETYLAEGNYTDALSMYLKIKNKFVLTLKQEKELEGMQIYMLWLQQLENEGKTIYELTENDLLFLIDFVSLNSGRGATYAKLLLCELYEICLEDESPSYTPPKPKNDDETIKEPEDSYALTAISSKALENITLIPNPTTGEFTINNEQLIINNVEVFDVFGRKVGAKFPSNLLEGWTRSGRGGKEGWQPQADGVVLDISHLASGIYFVKITTEKGVVVKKVVKQ